MNNNLAELEKLVSELYDGGLSDADMARLEQLLVDNPTLQDEYCGLVNTHVALTVAGTSTVENERPQAPQSQALCGTPDANKDTPAAPAPSYSTSKRPYSFNIWHMAALAATVLLAAIGWQQWTGSQGQDSLLTQDPSGSHAWNSGLNSLPTITHVSWEGPSFTADSDYWQPVAAVSGGAISLQQDEGEAADGYLFSLQPGMEVELVASCDATGQNSLSITEITYDAKPSTKKLTFHNKGDQDGPKPLHANPSAKNRKYGVLGRWSEVNTTARPRYFLLTGVHKLVDLYPDDEWRVSEMGVLLETNSVIHVGWDDSGPAPVERGEAYQQDQDYDDLAAYLFFSPIGAATPRTADDFQVVSPHQVPDLVIPVGATNGMEFELPPGATVVVKAIADATDPNALAVVDSATGEILWASAKDEPGNSYLGTTAVQNTSHELKQMRLVGMNRPKSDPENWVPSQMRVSYSQPNFFIVGFEDSERDDDFNDIRASLLIETGSPETSAASER